jgi:hypothetical protein
LATGVTSYHIQELPENLPPGEYDVRLNHVFLVKCRDGSVDTVFNTTFRGPRHPKNPSLLHFTKVDAPELDKTTPDRIDLEPEEEVNIIRNIASEIAEAQCAQ